jgi:hypothetical protein
MGNRSLFTYNNRSSLITMATEDMDTTGASAQDDSIVIVAPKGLPESYEFGEKFIYVRDCYPMFYESVMKLLERPDVRVVSVTGTPGLERLYVTFISLTDTGVKTRTRKF